MDMLQHIRLFGQKGDMFNDAPRPRQRARGDTEKVNCRALERADPGQPGKVSL